MWFYLGVTFPRNNCPSFKAKSMFQHEKCTLKFNIQKSHCHIEHEAFQCKHKTILVQGLVPLSTLLKLVLFVFCRDAVSDLALHFLNKMKILVVRDIERDEIEFICKVVYGGLVCFSTLGALMTFYRVYKKFSCNVSQTIFIFLVLNWDQLVIKANAGSLFKFK